MGKDYLPLPYQKRRALYYFYWSVFNFYDGAPIVSSVISRDFIKKFIPMLDIYYGEGSREITLKTIKLFWNFADDEDKQNFINISKSIIESPLGSAKGKVIDFVVDKIDTFSKAQKSLIVEAFKKYLEQNPSSIRKGIIEGIIIKIS
jgi:hypothetical protein